MVERLKAKVEACEKEVAHYQELIAKAYGKIELLNELIEEESKTEVELYCDNSVYTFTEKAEEPSEVSGENEERPSV